MVFPFSRGRSDGPSSTWQLHSYSVLPTASIYGLDNSPDDDSAEPTNVVSLKLPANISTSEKAMYLFFPTHRTTGPTFPVPDLLARHPTDYHNRMTTAHKSPNMILRLYPVPISFNQKSAIKSRGILKQAIRPQIQPQHISNTVQPSTAQASTLLYIDPSTVSPSLATESLSISMLVDHFSDPHPLLPFWTSFSISVFYYRNSLSHLILVKSPKFHNF